MPEPGSLVFAQSAHEATGLPIGTAVLMQPRQTLEQRIDKCFPQPPGRPVFQRLEIEYMPDNREMGVNIRTNVNVAADDFQRIDSSVLSILLFIPL